MALLLAAYLDILFVREDKSVIIIFALLFQSMYLGKGLRGKISGDLPADIFNLKLTIMFI